MNVHILGLAFCLSTALSAQDITNYTQADGLLDNTINCVSVDDEGRVWLGTNSGVSMFDGAEWISFTMDSHPGLIDNSIRAIFASNSGVWVGTDYGVSVYNGSYWTSFTEEDGLGDNRINHINQSDNGAIWFGEKDGISIYDPMVFGDAWISYSTSDGLPFGGINYINFDASGDAWLASSIFGLIHFDGLNFITYNTDSGLISNNVRSIAIDANGNKWIGTAQGITVFDIENTVDVQHSIMLLLPPPDELNPVVDVKIDSNGNVWAGIYVDYLVTVGGVAYWDGDSWTGLNESVLVGPVVRSLDIDSENNIWVATSTGLSKISTSEISLPDFSDDFECHLYPNPGISELFLDSNKEIETLIMTNIQGKQVYVPKENTDSGIRLDVSLLDQGFYILDMHTENLNLRRKVLIH